MVAAGRHLKQFVGGHPMAGRESSGPAGASGSLFRGATWVLTTDNAGPADLAAVEEDRFGARGDPGSDGFGRSRCRGGGHQPSAPGGGVGPGQPGRPAFDRPRPGSRWVSGHHPDRPVRSRLGGPMCWSRTGRRSAPCCGAWATICGTWADLIESEDREAVGAEMLAARTARRSLSAPVAAVGVVLDDKPGEIARVGHALETSGVDLRDLQLRHATHGGGGVLTLSVKAAEADRLKAALTADGFRLLD